MQNSLRKTDYLHLTLVLFCSFAVYLCTLQNQFALDDVIHIVQNPLIKNSASWSTLFSSSTYPGNLFRPLTNFSYALTYHFWALWPFPYHLENVLLHAAVSGTLFCLLSLIGFRTAAFSTALLFALHPLHSEAVANVSGRAELLAALFGLLSLYLFVASTHESGTRTRATLCFSALCFLAALLSKESALVILPLIPLILILQSRRIQKHVPAFLCLCLVALLFFIWRWMVVGVYHSATGETEFLDNPLIAINASQRILVALALLGKYFTLCVYPLPLSADYSFAVIDPVHFWSLAENWLNLVLVFALGGMALFAFRRNQQAWFFSAWFFVSFLVTANIFVPIGTIFAERLAYLPSIGAIGLLAFSIERYLSPLRGKLTLYALAVLYALQIFNHSRVWENNNSLHSYQMSISPQSAKTLANYGMVLRNRGDLEPASLLFRQALHLYPYYTNAAYGLGSLYLLKGSQSGAEHWFNHALHIDPQHLPSKEALGRLYLNNQKFGDARIHFESMLEKDPTSLSARIGILAVLIGEQKLQEAQEFRNKLAPSAQGNPEFDMLSKKLDAIRTP